MAEMHNMAALCVSHGVSEEECRHHLDTMTSNRRLRQNSPLASQPGSTSTGRWQGSPKSQCGPLVSSGQNGSPRMQHGPTGRHISPPTCRAVPGAYSNAAARGAQVSAPPPLIPPSRLPPLGAPPQVAELINTSSTPLQQKLAAGVPLLILMRGLPGSGKSTLAKQIAGQHGFVASADDFFTNKHGQYVFRPDRLTDAHEQCRNRVRQALRRGQTPVVVDNTNTEAWEMTPYVELAVQFDYYVEIAEPTTPWRHDPKLLSKRSVHSVPERNIERMRDRFQGSDIVNVSSLHR